MRLKEAKSLAAPEQNHSMHARLILRKAELVIGKQGNANARKKLGEDKS